MIHGDLKSIVVPFATSGDVVGDNTILQLQVRLIYAEGLGNVAIANVDGTVRRFRFTQQRPMATLEGDHTSRHTTTMPAERPPPGVPSTKSALEIAIGEKPVVAQHQWQVDVERSNTGSCLAPGTIARPIVGGDAEGVGLFRLGGVERVAGLRGALQPGLPGAAILLIFHRVRYHA